jgi:hypothetical protein
MFKKFQDWKKKRMHSMVLQKKFVPEGKTVNQHFYKDVLQSLWLSIHCCCPELRRLGRWFLLNDNMRLHTTLSVHQFLARHQVPVLPQPPILPELVTMWFCLFPQLKWPIPAIKVAMTEQLQHSRKYLPDLQNCWQQCINAGGAHFEGDWQQ